MFFKNNTSISIGAISNVQIYKIKHRRCLKFLGEYFFIRKEEQKNRYNENNTKLVIIIEKSETGLKIIIKK
jgi:hypothetical protein